MERRPASAPAARHHDEWWWIFDPRLSLRARAACLFAAIAILFVVLMSSFGAWLFRQSLERELGPSFEGLAQQVSDKLDRTIYERRHALEFTAALAAFKTSANDAATNAQRRDALEALAKEYPEFAWIGFADRDGNITAATHGWLEGSTATLRSWFHVGARHVHVGRVQELSELARRVLGRDDENAVRFLDLAAPVRDDNGDVVGVLGAYLRWEWTRDVAFSVITESLQHRQIGVTVYAGDTDVILDSGASGWTVPPNAPPLPSLHPYRGSMTEDSSVGTKYFSGYVRSRGFRDYRGLAWLVTVRQPFQRAFAPVTELRWLIFRWGCGFAAIGVVVSWIAAGRVVRRLRSVAAAADRVREGDVLAELPQPRDEGEISRMCAALGELVADFRAKNDALAAENARLEAEARKRDSVKRD
jgi:HAMP domain-containing protein